MWFNLQHKQWYLAVAVMAAGLVIIAMGGGLFGQAGPWFDQWQHKAFRTLCHQIPERSYTLNGTPMAVCSRCFGLYASFAFGWLTFPLAGRWVRAIKPWSKKLLLGVVLINMIDIIGNVLGFWENTLASRLWMGAIVGIAAALILGHEFIGKQQPIKG